MLQVLLDITTIGSSFTSSATSRDVSLMIRLAAQSSVFLCHKSSCKFISIQYIPDSFGATILLTYTQSLVSFNSVNTSSITALTILNFGLAVTSISKLSSGLALSGVILTFFIFKVLNSTFRVTCSDSHITFESASRT
jgi:hypothetical protein